MRFSIKVAALLLAMGFISLAVMGAVSAAIVYVSLNATLENNLFSLAAEVGKAVMRNVREGYNTTLLLAKNPILRSSAASREEQLNEIVEANSLFPYFNDITLLDARGNIRASVLHVFRGYISRTKWYKDALEGRSSISDVHAVLYPYGVVLTFSTPVRNERGEIDGVLVGHFDMEKIRRITSSVSVERGGRVMLVNRGGVIVSDNDPAMMLEELPRGDIRRLAEKREKGLVRITEKGLKKVAVYVPIMEAEQGFPQWSVLVIIPEREAFATLRKARLGMIGAGALCMILAAAAGFVFSRKITERVHKLTTGTRRLGEGDFFTRIEDLGGDELGTLGRSFNAALDRLTISENKRQEAESALTEAHVGLERRVEERTLDLANAIARLRDEVLVRRQAERETRVAKEAAEKANRAKSEFLANMSHELRTPLNHIIGFTELVAGGTAGTLNKTQLEYLGDVLESGTHLLSLINDILDLSKIEAGKTEFEPAQIELRPLLEKGLNRIREKALAHRITISIDFDGLPDRGRVDERKLKQVMYNLLSNAVKFTPDGGVVKVWAGLIPPGAEAERMRGECVRVSVSDTGIGIAAENLERIFSPFEQADSSTSRKYQGAGLGLALARRFVELHGGRIWAESGGPNSGSSLIFVIPVDGPAG